MAAFEIPEDIKALSDDSLNDALAGAVSAFDATSQSTTVTPGDLESLRALATCVDDIRTEQAARHQAAEAAAAEIDALAAQIRGADPEPDPAPEETTAAADEEPPTVPAQAPAPEPMPAAATAAAVVQRPALDLSGIRRRQPSVLPPPPAPTTEITAAVDVPGFTPGQRIDFGAVTSGIIARANALKTAGGGVGQVISYRHPYPPELIVTDSSSAPEGTTVAMRAADQRRLPQKDLVASGGWCAPSETVYDLIDTACPDMLWDAPEIQLARGGLRYFKPLSLDVAAMTWVHTEADDIAGSTKPCFKIPCPEPTEVRCEAVGVCLEAGILTQRHFPELVDWYTRNAITAHEIRLRQELFAAAVATATPVTIAATWGAMAAVYGAVALQTADLIERHSLCEGTAIEVVFPWWTRNLFFTDLARRNGIKPDEVTAAMVQEPYTAINTRIQWARALPPAVPAEIGGPTPAVDWPTSVQFLMYPAGQLQIGRGEEVNLGVVHDSTKFVTNDYTALFSEECVALVDRSIDTRVVTVPVCPSGETGAQTLLTCPAA
ncbi:hypothetical protein GCM10010387_15590 [Streptomyces inusitatus]|uniref:Major capsid protein n=1 Tax=Streptomyces inusitatus TaxID=68221 RepID=A0A918PUN8_9ACTN|nr:major capsid protein [Streptomyces inusitatus]GGZ23339.1 hypothetical protein GCM10010387_15590 [Streptomyces inusitatus]